MPGSFAAAGRRAELVAWYRGHGRDLPWRRRTDAYAVLVSEFMCQQTTVAAVIPYFERWMAAFPTVRALAEADEESVLGLWQGLGYYSRARNLHRAARAVVERHGGEVPDDWDALRALPGVGEYTAGAVVAFAFDRPAPVVDANVARVLARWMDLREPVDSTAGRVALREAARALQPEGAGAREINSAVMELGALVCKPRAPLCLACPVRGGCRATEPELLPVKRPRAAVTEVTERRAFVVDTAGLHLLRSTGRWRGMWILPETAAGGEIAHVERYPITRYRVRMEVVRQSPAEWSGLRAFGWDEVPSIPIPSPHRRAIEALVAKGRAVHREGHDEV